MRARAILTASVLLALALPAGAQARSGVYTTCQASGETILVEVAAATCEDVQPVVTALAAKPPEEVPSVVSAAGWSVLRAQPAEAANGQYDVVAIRGLATVRVRLRGTAPDLDGWEAGRELLFARGKLVGGKPPPRGASLCTSAFLVRLGSGRLGGLSAAHCGGLRKDRTVQRRNVALRRPPVPGIVLGRVLRILTRTRPYDALVLPVLQGASRPASPVIDRGIARPPWRVVATAKPLSRRAICMTGRTSGVDKCGQIVSSRFRRIERLVSHIEGTIVRCTTIRAAPGDSGGPVYTKPAADGTVRAIGIVTLIFRPAGDLMCFTPIKPVLAGLRARLVAAHR